MPHFQAGTGVPFQSDEDPREAKTIPPEVKIRNRRRKYLNTHPEYLNDPELELAGLFCLSFRLNRGTDGSHIPFTMGPPCAQVAKPGRKRS